MIIFFQTRPTHGEQLVKFAHPRSSLDKHKVDENTVEELSLGL